MKGQSTDDDVVDRKVKVLTLMLLIESVDDDIINRAGKVLLLLKIDDEDYMLNTLNFQMYYPNDDVDDALSLLLLLLLMLL